MSKFSEIMKSGKFNELSSICESKGLILCQNADLENNLFICSMTESKSNKPNTLNYAISDKNVRICIIEPNSKTVFEDFTKDYNTDNELIETIDDALDTLDLVNQVDIDPEKDNKELLVEDEIEDDNSPVNIVSELDRCKMEIKHLSDRLKDLSSSTDNIEMISIILDIANNGYSLSLDIESAIDTYNDIMGVQEQEDEDNKVSEDLEKSISENSERINVAKAQLSMRNLYKLQKVTKEQFERYIDCCKEIFD